MTRNFSGGPDTDDVVDLLDVARRAPSAGFAQGCHFLLLEGADKESFFDRSGAGDWFARRAPGVRDCSHVVLVLADPAAYTARYSEPDKVDRGLSSSDSWTCPYWLTDAAMAAQNLLLLCEERRWGALLFGLYADQRDTLSALGVPDEVHCVGAIAIGHRADHDAPTGSATTRTRRPLDEVVHVGRWGTPADTSAGFSAERPEV